MEGDCAPAAVHSTSQQYGLAHAINGAPTAISPSEKWKHTHTHTFFNDVRWMLFFFLIDRLIFLEVGVGDYFQTGSRVVMLLTLFQLKWGGASTKKRTRQFLVMKK